jgi:hypothetical protein
MEGKLPTYEKFINEGTVNEAFDSYHDLYIAKSNFEMKIGRKNWDIAEGSVFEAVGGGNWEIVNPTLKAMFSCGIDDIQRYSTFFEIVPNPVWPTTINTVNIVESFGRKISIEVSKDPKNARKIIDARMKKLAEVQKMFR